MSAVVMLAFSYLAFNAARRTGRNPVIWIGLVWVLGTVCAIPFAIVGAIGDFLLAQRAGRETEAVESYLSYWAGAAGTTIGSGFAVLRAGRPIPELAILADVVDESPKQ
jgi:hypothetical protein